MSLNTGQGSHFTGSAWITTLTEADVKIFIERLWRPLKQEAVDLHELQNGFQAKRVIKDRLTFYNFKRPHPALDKQSPDDALCKTERTQLHLSQGAKLSE